MFVVWVKVVEFKQMEFILVFMLSLNTVFGTIVLLRPEFATYFIAGI